MCRCTQLLLCLAFVPPVFSAADTGTAEIPAGTVIFAGTPGSRKLPRLRPGTPIDAIVEQTVFVNGRALIPSGTQIRTAVEMPVKAERRRGMAGAMTAAAQFVWDPMSVRKPPRRSAVLRQTVLTLPGGQNAELSALLYNALRVAPVTPEKKHSAPQVRLLFEVRQNAIVPASNRQETAVTALPPVSGPEPGTRARLILLSGLDSTRNHQGDTFEAALADPVKLPGGGELLPGVRFQGHVVRNQPARVLRRGGKLQIGFTRLVFPTGESKEISAYVTELELDKSQKTSLSSEGAISGGPVGWKATTVDLALSYTVGKITDDLIEEGIKAAMSSTSSAAAASAARYFGLGAGLAWFFAHRGRDAVLPQYTLLEITFNRPVPVRSSPATGLE